MPRSDQPGPLSPAARARRSPLGPQWQPAQCRDRIDPAGRQEDQSTAVMARIVEAVDRAEEVGVEQIARAAVIAGMDRGLGRALDHQVGRRQRVEILGVAHVAMDKADAAGAQPRQCELAAAAVQIIESDDLLAAPFGQQQTQIRADEAGPSGDQDAHGPPSTPGTHSRRPGSGKIINAASRPQHCPANRLWLIICSNGCLIAPRANVARRRPTGGAHGGDHHHTAAAGDRRRRAR